MSKRLRAAALFSLFCAIPLDSATNPFTDYVDWRYHLPKMRVKEVEGLDQRIVDGKLHLVLRDFLVLALRNSTDIQLTRLDVYTASNQIIGAKAPFDPVLQLSFNTLRSVSPISFFEVGGLGGTNSLTGTGLGNTTGITTGTNPGTGSGTTLPVNQITLPETISSLSQTSVASFSELLPTGQTLGANFTAVRSSGFGLPYPELFGTLNITLTQHLLQNRSNIQAKGPLQIARTQLLIASKKSEATIADSLTNAAHLYWNAVLARDNIRVQAQNLELARKSYDRDKQALDLGALARLDIYQSEAQVAERNRDFVQAQYQYRAALDGLRRLIGADLTPKLRETEIVLDDDPSALPPASAILPFEEALKNAIAARPENIAARGQTSVDELNARIARDALLPQLDLSAQGGSSGPALNQVSVGSTTGLPTTNPYPGLAGTLGQVLGFQYPSYGFGLQLTFPLRNSTAKASLANALVSRAHDAYQQRQTQQQITYDVRQAIDSIELANASIEAAGKARDLAQKNVEAEQQKYQLGTITAFELLDSQAKLANSESALLAAYVNYQLAYVDYQRATWTLLDGLGMVLETPPKS